MLSNIANTRALAKKQQYYRVKIENNPNYLHKNIHFPYSSDVIKFREYLIFTGRAFSCKIYGIVFSNGCNETKFSKVGHFYIPIQQITKLFIGYDRA